jgi:hypothetical protein
MFCVVRGSCNACSCHLNLVWSRLRASFLPYYACTAVSNTQCAVSTGTYHLCTCVQRTIRTLRRDSLAYMRSLARMSSFACRGFGVSACFLLECCYLSYIVNMRFRLSRWYTSQHSTSGLAADANSKWLCTTGTPVTGVMLPHKIKAAAACSA